MCPDGRAKINQESAATTSRRLTGQDLLDQQLRKLDRIEQDEADMREMRGMKEPRIESITTWNDLYAALRAAGYEKAAVLIESWQDEYLPGKEDNPLPGESYG